MHAFLLFLFQKLIVIIKKKKTNLPRKGCPATVLPLSCPVRFCPLPVLSGPFLPCPNQTHPVPSAPYMGASTLT